MTDFAALLLSSLLLGLTGGFVGLRIRRVKVYKERLAQLAHWQMVLAPSDSKLLMEVYASRDLNNLARLQEIRNNPIVVVSDRTLADITLLIEATWFVEPRVLVRVTHLLDVWALFLPARVVKEDLSDYLEDIRRRASQGQVLSLYTRFLAAVFWTGVNAIGYFLEKVGKRRAV